MERRLLSGVLAAALGLTGIALSATVAAADSQTTTDAPITCQTRFGAQPGQFTTTWTDDVDPVVAGEPVSYRVTTPFKQTLPNGVSGSYKGGQVFYKIPAGITVTAVSTQPPPGGSQLSASASRQGDDIVVTTTGNVPINGTTYPTPDLIIEGTAAPEAAGSQIRWLLPYRILANVDINGLGPVDADCAPNNPNTVIATTNVSVPGNRSPVIENQSVPVTKNTPKVVKLRATDADGDALAFTTGNPRHGTLSVSGANATYTPATGYLGTDSFTFTASDGRGGAATGRVDLNVISTAEGDAYPPTITLTAPAHGAVYTPNQVVRAAFTCADGESGLQSCTGTVANNSAISTSAGRHDFKVTAVDKGGNKTEKLISYRVVNRTPVAQTYTAIANQPNIIPITCDQPVVLFDQRIPAAASAPQEVPEADTFVLRLSPGAMSVPPSTIATNAKYVIAPPTRGTIVDAQVVPDTGSANAASSIASIVDGRAVLMVPSVDGGLTGTTFTPRQIDVTIRTTAVPTQQVTTSFERFQVRLTTGQAGVNILTTDYDCPGGSTGAPNPILTRTTTIDVTPPTVTLNAPVHGGRYLVGQSVPASFSCSDARGVSSCTGTAPNGAAVNTSAAGTRQFVVRATDTAGNVTQALASYKTFNAVTVNAAFTTTERQQLDAAAAAFGVPADRLIKVVVYLLSIRLETDANPAPLAGPPAGNRPAIVPINYLPNDAALVEYQASRYALASPAYHWYAGALAIAIHQLYGGG